MSIRRNKHGPQPGAIHRSRVLLTAAMLVGFLGVNAAPAAATSHSVVDQEQTQQELYSAYGVGCPGHNLSPLAQTFAAGRNGLLDSVVLKLVAGDPANTPDLIVQIRAARTGLVGEDVLAAATVSPSSAQTDPNVVTGDGTREILVSFVEPAMVVAGEKYAVVLVVPAGIAPCPAYTGGPSSDKTRPDGWHVAVGPDPQSYTSGEVIVGYDGSTLDTFAPLNPDIWFRTFVSEGAEPVAPVVTSLTPAAVTAGSPAFTLKIAGVGFTAESQVLWNGALLTTTYVSGSQLDAAVPAELVATSGTGTVTVLTGDVATAPRSLFITDTDVTVSSVTTTTSSDPTVPAEVSAGDTTGTASGGTGTLTVAHYASNPTTDTFPTGTTAPAYFDVNLSPDSTFSSVTVTVCQLSGTTLYWYDATGAGWTAVSSQVYDPTTGCITAELTPTTSPNTTQLGGTAFATATTADTLSAMTTRYVQDPKLHKALQRQISAATAAAKRGDIRAKKGALGAYIRLVSAHSGKRVSAANAKALIAMARTL